MKHNIDHLIQRSMQSETDIERRFAHAMKGLMNMREGISLESAIQEDPIAVALLESGVTALDSAISILKQTWPDSENE